jgi:glycosyltransferase involved in cell wall biosynthesis
VKISIIVPAYNEEKLLGDSLRCIHNASRVFAKLGWATELIVCDNNSTDRTAELARSSGARVVFEPINQIARARNTGAAAATGDWLMFIDADSCPSPELFEDVAVQIQNGQCVGGGSTVRFDESLGPARFLVCLWNGLSQIMRWMAGSFIFCHAAAFNQLGGFNLEFYVSEEIDFSRRLKRWARPMRKSIVILYRHPLLTSARKLHLYSRRDMLRVLTHALWRHGQTFKERDACKPWYDGRR